MIKAQYGPIAKIALSNAMLALRFFNLGFAANLSRLTVVFSVLSFCTIKTASLHVWACALYYYFEIHHGAKTHHLQI